VKVFRFEGADIHYLLVSGREATTLRYPSLSKMFQINWLQSCSLVEASSFKCRFLINTGRNVGGQQLHSQYYPVIETGQKLSHTNSSSEIKI